MLPVELRLTESSKSEMKPRTSDLLKPTHTTLQGSLVSGKTRADWSSLVLSCIDLMPIQNARRNASTAFEMNVSTLLEAPTTHAVMIPEEKPITPRWWLELLLGNSTKWRPLASVVEPEKYTRYRRACTRKSETPEMIGLRS
jgi:hypothetical protein